MLHATSYILPTTYYLLHTTYYILHTTYYPNAKHKTKHKTKRKTKHNTKNITKIITKNNTKNNTKTRTPHDCPRRGRNKLQRSTFVDRFRGQKLSHFFLDPRVLKTTPRPRVHIGTPECAFFRPRSRVHIGTPECAIFTCEGATPARPRPRQPTPAQNRLSLPDQRSKTPPRKKT